MTSGTDTTGHPDVSEISDLAEGLLPTTRTSDVRRHLAECPDCADVHAALEEIRGLLGTLPGVGDAARMPDDVVTRIDAALATEALLSTGLPAEGDEDGGSSAGTDADTAADSVPTPDAAAEADEVSRETSAPEASSAAGFSSPGSPASDRPSRPVRRPSLFTGPGRKRRRLDGRRRSAVLGALLTVAVVGAGGLMFELVENSPGGASSSSADSGAKTVPSSTVDAFSKNELENQVTDLLTGQQGGKADPDGPDDDAANSPGVAENPQTKLQPSVVVPDCIRLGLSQDDDALGAAPGTYNGDEAYLVVLPDASDRSRVVAYVVDATCVTDHTLTPGKVLLKQSYARP
ncbi:zf-HC2 domain-containing protein [Streptomyces sp. NPDC008150]|uniref:anti-sigma factor family protein n=1 Tax=Streptomyces sp. NPDC008150 TaxID=3364816 RepID=UPI0036F0B616